MVRQHKNNHILKQRLHTQGTKSDLLIQAVFIINDRSYQIRADEHQEDTTGGMNTQRVAEDIHDQSNYRANNHVSGQ